MNKAALKKLAVRARTELMEAVAQRAREKGITEDISAVAEDAACTWFVYFISLRYMEVNGFLLKKAPFEEMGEEEIIDICSDLYKMLPCAFCEIKEHHRRLFPKAAFDNEGIIIRMINEIPVEDWTDSVQIIGWLYQYYNTELKNEAFALLRKNVKTGRERLPVATQLFTPDWIVRYMVENSLGRLWLSAHPDRELKRKWKYFIDEDRENKTTQQDASIRPEEIRLIDPCAGSGQILIYAFDVLMQIYMSCGHTAEEAAGSIVKNNLYGLDIDERISRLACFSVMMKARRYDEAVFEKGIQPNIMSIGDTDFMDEQFISLFSEKNRKLKRDIRQLRQLYENAKEYGSLIRDDIKTEDIKNRTEEILCNFADNELISKTHALKNTVKQTEMLSAKYHIAVTNPPYMKAVSMSKKLYGFAEKNYPDSKHDLYACFMERCAELTKENGYLAMLTQHSWMFVSCYERLREKLLEKTMVNMIHLGAKAFEEIGGEVVQTAAFVLQNGKNKEHKGTYCRLTEEDTQQGKESAFLSKEHRYIISASDFSKLPGKVFAYWVSRNTAEKFERYPKLSEMGAARLGMTTGENARFVRYWYEVDRRLCEFNVSSQEELCGKSGYWVPYNKGGTYRKWYGNNDYVLYWKNGGEAIRSFADENGRIRSTVPNVEYYFLPCASWSKISTGRISFRYKNNSIFDVAGACYFAKKYDLRYMMGLLNSAVTDLMTGVLSPTLNYEGGQIASLPIVYDEETNGRVCGVVEENIRISKADWDSFETSWNFMRHPLICCTAGEKMARLIEDRYKEWEKQCKERFDRLKANEEELNRIFIDLYGLNEELSPKVEDRDITVRKADLQREIKSLISYAVGCMFGRYSVDEDGVIYAGGQWDESRYKTIPPVKDNIIPLCDDGNGQGITARFISFVRTVYGQETLEENLRFIADALGGKGEPTEAINNYFLTSFYTDHLKTYQKRPVYWLFSSGRKNGFRALVYMHRYTESLLSQMSEKHVASRREYLNAEITKLNESLENLSSANRAKIKRQTEKIREQLAEIKCFDEKLRCLSKGMTEIDLDDGVKVNYAKFEGVLEKIK